MLQTISESCSALPVRALGLSVVLSFASAPARADAPRTESVVARAKLSVERVAGAEGCADAVRLADALRALVGAGDAASGTFAIRVTFGREDADFTAQIVIEGLGVRALRAPGPTCNELERDVTAALVVVIDQPVVEPNQNGRPTPVAKSPSTTGTELESSAKPSSKPTSSSSPWSGSLFGGGGLTIGVASKALAWASADLWVTPEGVPLTFALGAWTTFDATEEFAPGGVNVRWTGGVARACFSIGGARSLRVLGCGSFDAGALRASATGYAVTRPAVYRPFFAAGPGVFTRGPLGGRLDWSIDVHALFPLHHENFEIEDAGVVFHTRTVGVWLGLGVGTRIW